MIPEDPFDEGASPDPSLLEALDGATEVADYLDGVRSVLQARGYSEEAVERMVVQTHWMVMRQVVLGSAERTAENLHRKTGQRPSFLGALLGL